MAQAALQEEQIPSGGIAEFIMSDEDLAALEAEEAREAFGDSGIAQFEPLAKRMASYGRFGDDSLAHVETGELIVPRALIEQSPQLKASIFNHLRELGIEDPERYVVGASANSLNPDTGLPEFFLKKLFRGAKKAVSGIVRGVKKAIKSVGKVLKKVAPVVLPIVGTLAFGPIYGAALGSGIGTLVQGGSIKDALKSALISGATGAVTAGTFNKLQGGTFMEGVKNAANTANLSAGFQSLGRAATGDFSGFSTANMRGGPASPGGTAFTPAETAAQATDISQATSLAGQPPTDQAFAQPDYSPVGRVPSMDPNVAAINDPFFQNADGTFNQARYNAAGFDGTTMKGLDYRYGGTSGAVPATAAPMTSAEQAIGMLDASYNPQVAITDTNAFLQTQTPATPSFFDQMKSYATDAGDYMFRGGKSAQEVALAQDAAEQAYLAKAARTGIAPTEAGLAAARSAAGPGMLARFGPSLALAGAGAAAGGFFTPPPVEDPDLVQRDAQGNVVTGTDLIALNPDDYLVGGGDPRYSSGQYVVGTQYGLPSSARMFRNPFMRPQMVPQMAPQMAPQMYAAEGGEVYPRRNGGIMPDEGIPNQDSVRALLMPGEFVMTKDAVRGLGNGNMNQGINNMYSMMRNLESKGRAA